MNNERTIEGREWVKRNLPKGASKGRYQKEIARDIVKEVHEELEVIK